jgi:glycosyltransferase involved in cell wall biosynthesis
MQEATVVYVDDMSPYSKSLYSNMVAQNKFHFIYYAPKSVFGKLTSKSVLPNMKRIWTSHLYPYQIAREIAKDKPDIVHIQFELNTFGSHYTSLLMFPLLTLLRALRRKVVVTVHTIIPRRRFTTEFTDSIIPSMFRAWHIPAVFYKSILDILYSFIGWFSESLIVHTNTQKRCLVNDYGILGKKIVVIPQGVDYSPPSPNFEKVQFWRKKIGNKRIILYFGSITPIKGLDWLIRSFSQLQKSYPNCVLVIVGSPNWYYTDYYNKTKKLVDTLNLGDTVIFTGWLTKSDLDNVFSLADVIVFPHVFPHSPSGTVAMVKKHRKKLIASNFGILKEQLIDYKRVVFVQAGDEEELAEAILSAIAITFPELESKFDNHHEDSWNRVALKTLLLYDCL